MTDPSREDRWQHLVQVSFLLEARDAEPGPDRRQSLCAVVDDLLEVFPSSVDPVDDFEAYAVRRFALALRRMLCEPD